MVRDRVETQFVGSDRLTARALIAKALAGPQAALTVDARAMTLAPAPVFRLALRVYWEDTDAAGIVFYANYLKFFERARTEWLRSLGFGQEALRREAGIAFVVSDTALRYRRPARLDDVIDVSVAVVHLGQASLEIGRASCRERCVRLCRSRWSPDH